ncbi:hypothetical protein GO594_27720 [Pseudomonas otitidis]|uniref:Uncharacterized protein n=1 Tax=Metapseudomonas otitidis TaxID=319939 RepID=A0A7X3HD49_9GAMM|nr:I78 family peptidase inhibitor [Pseudomonas otitidis]MWK59792.1 hypothetical protein [Pseudomonas otitidis]
MSDERWTYWPWRLLAELGNIGPVDPPWPLSLGATPASIKELIGRKCRVVRKGDVLTQEHVPGRVTVFIDDDGRIADIFFESDLPTV